MADVDDKDTVRCSRCRSRIGKQSDTALLLGTIYILAQLDFFCRECDNAESWVSRTVLLEREAQQALLAFKASEAKAALLATQLTEAQAALEAEKKKPKKQHDPDSGSYLEITDNGLKRVNKEWSAQVNTYLLSRQYKNFYFTTYAWWKYFFQRRNTSD